MQPARRRRKIPGKSAHFTPAAARKQRHHACVLGKPKRSPRLARLDDVRRDPRAAVLVDAYAED